MLMVMGGPTGAGSKRPKREPWPYPWACSKEHANPSYATRCLTKSCNEKRP